MSIQVEIMSRESIKPSTPTPPHLRTFKLGLFDLLAGFDRVSILLFYDNKDTKKIEFSDISRRLKTSLSETLSSFYPIAGRMNGYIAIECNDEGVDYVEARVKAQLEDVIKHRNVDQVLELLSPGDDQEPQLSLKVLLAIQVNLFECGGIVISVCLSHKISDAYSMITFINSWAAKTSDSNQLIHPISQQLSSLYPPSGLDLNSAPFQSTIPNLVTKRFVFDSSNIASLRAEVINNNSSCVPSPTRVELVSALLWRCFMELTRKKNGFLKECAAMHIVDLRKRMDGKGLENALGNLCAPTFTTSRELASENELYVLVGELRDAIRKMDSEFVTKIRRDGEYIQHLEDEYSKGISTGKTGLIMFTSWCRFPLYKANFGWGKPVWATGISARNDFKNVVALMDTRSGDGIEALVRMAEEDMAEFEQDEQLLSFLSSTHCVDC